MSTFIEPKSFLALLQAQMTKEMELAAEPVIRQAVLEAEKEMRKKLSAMFISLIEQSFELYTDKSKLHIVISNIPKGT